MPEVDAARVILIFFLAVIAIKDLLKYIYIWQRKEYRLDKMVDFLRTKESLEYLVSSFLVLRLFSLLLLIIAGFFQSPSSGLFFQITNWTFYLILGVEAFGVFYLIVSKKIKKPKFTSKAVFILFLSFIPVFVLPLLFTNLNDLINIILSVWINLLFLPIYIAAIILLTPLDIYLKQKIFDKALERRKRLTSLGVVAVSGSYGKTTTKEILYKIFNLKYKTEKTEKYQNTTISCAKKILALNEKTKIFICEIGSYRAGDGIDICRFALPNAAIITGLNYQHFGLFGSEENIIRGESEAMDFLNKGDKVIINYNSKLCRKIKVPDHLKRITYGLQESGIDLDYCAKNIHFDGESSHFILEAQGREFRLKTNLISRGNIQNLVGAICLAHQTGIAISKITEVLGELEVPEGTLSITEKPYGKLIDDSHNANYDGVKNALETMEMFKLPNIIIFDEIVELGILSEETHRKIGQDFAKVDPELVVLLGKSFSDTVKEELLKLGYPEEKIYLLRNRNQEEVINKVNSLLKRHYNSVVLAEGFRTKALINKLPA